MLDGETHLCFLHLHGKMVKGSSACSASSFRGSLFGFQPFLVLCGSSLGLAGPLRVRFGFIVGPEMLGVRRWGFFHRPQLPFWSLLWVLAGLPSPLFGLNASLKCLFYKALFLVALASGSRASQLCAMMWLPSLTSFALDFSAVSCFLPWPSLSDGEGRPFAYPGGCPFLVGGRWVSLFVLRLAFGATWLRLSGPLFLLIGSGMILFVLVRSNTLPWCCAMLLRRLILLRRLELIWSSIWLLRLPSVELTHLGV